MSRRRMLRELSRAARILFEYLEEKKWKDAEAAMKRIQNCETSRGEERVRGYINALQGMLTGLRERHSSPKPLILTIGNNSQNRLRELEKTFYRQSCKGLNADYDRGFFGAWYEYVKFLIDKSPYDEG